MNDNFRRWSRHDYQTYTNKQKYIEHLRAVRRIIHAKAKMATWRKEAEAAKAEVRMATGFAEIINIINEHAVALIVTAVSKFSSVSIIDTLVDGYSIGLRYKRKPYITYDAYAHLAPKAEQIDSDNEDGQITLIIRDLYNKELTKEQLVEYSVKLYMEINKPVLRTRAGNIAKRNIFFDDHHNVCKYLNVYTYNLPGFTYSTTTQTCRFYFVMAHFPAWSKMLEQTFTAYALRSNTDLSYTEFVQNHEFYFQKVTI